jgi:hypothetical protein
MMGTSEKNWLNVAACRQTAAFLRKIEPSGFLPKAATPFSVVLIFTAVLTFGLGRVNL